MSSQRSLRAFGATSLYTNALAQSSTELTAMYPNDDIQGTTVEAADNRDNATIDINDARGVSARAAKLGCTVRDDHFWQTYPIQAMPTKQDIWDRQMHALN